MQIQTRARVVKGVSSAGFTTQVHPAARAAATCRNTNTTENTNTIKNTNTISKAKAKVKLSIHLPGRHANWEVPGTDLSK